jgi:predicted CXXCH cytochrome family protein
VKAKMCGQCHPEPGKADSLEPKRAGVDLCRGCHASMVNETLGRNRIHWPVVDRIACLNCHRPHATRRPNLLAEDQKTLCGRCHPDAIERQDKSLTKHEPVNDGECTACHDPHAADPIALLSAPVPEVCGNCHDWGKHSTHPMGEKVLDPRNKNLQVRCLSCHRSHGTPFKGFTHFDPKMDLCVQCHESFKR